MGRFIQADTIVLEPGNPQSLNRYSYVLNNPLRYTDPTGRYSEDEIMQAFGVKTWEEVLASFQEGGALAGLWGWLEVLRQAQDGYFVSYGMDPRFAPPGPATGWAWGDPHNGGLFSRNADGQIMVGTAAHSSFANAYQEVYSLWQRDSSQPNVWKPQLFTYPDASHYHLKIKEMDQIDWVGAGMDIASIAADALTAGTGGRALNSLQVMATAVGNGLDIAGLAYSGATRMSDGIITASEQWDVVFAIWGTQFPFVFDFASLATNFFLISR